MTVRAAVLFAVLLFALPSVAQQGVIVNGVALDPQTISQLQRIYGAIAPGRYWYDPTSGLWGRERGPTAGQIAPGLRLGGPLRRDASGGGTGVFVNGRELHPTDVARLRQLYGTVNPGRYWLNAQGIGGYEGGPAQSISPRRPRKRRSGAAAGAATTAPRPAVIS